MVLVQVVPQHLELLVLHHILPWNSFLDEVGVKVKHASFRIVFVFEAHQVESSVVLSACYSYVLVDTE